MKCLRFVVIVLLLGCDLVHAQFLPDNTSLNVQSVQRWMESNRDLAAIVQAVDAMHTSDADTKLFDNLPAAEQDKQINMFLQQKNILTAANTVTARHGWKSIGEYMRLSTKLGNAIAAYFLADSMAGMLPEQKKAILEKADPDVLATPVADVNFVKANETLLKQYIQAYAKGR